MPKKSDYNLSNEKKKVADASTSSQKTISVVKSSKVSHEHSPGPKETARASRRIIGNQSPRPKGRRVKFAQPLSKQLVYERPISPAPPRDDIPQTETLAQMAISMKHAATTLTVKHEHDSRIDQLEPPYSLIAHLDLAAKKLHAREKDKEPEKSAEATKLDKKKSATPEETKLDTIKSTKSSKSLKSGIGGFDSKMGKK